MQWPRNILSFIGFNTFANITEFNAGFSYALTHMDPQDKRILLQKFTCGYDDETIAKSVGVSIPTVHKALDRARNHMLQPTVLPLIMLGKTEGLAQIREMFATFQRNPAAAPISYLSVDSALTSALHKAGCSCVGDILYFNQMQDIKGVGPKYANALASRINDLKLVAREYHTLECGHAVFESDADTVKGSDVSRCVNDYFEMQSQEMQLSC